VGGWVGPRASLQSAKNLILTEFDPRKLERLASRYTGYDIPVHVYLAKNL